MEIEKEENKEQELCNAVTNILFSIIWKGYDTHHKSIWKVRNIHDLEIIIIPYI